MCTFLWCFLFKVFCIKNGLLLKFWWVFEYLVQVIIMVCSIVSFILFALHMGAGFLLIRCALRKRSLFVLGWWLLPLFFLFHWKNPFSALILNTCNICYLNTIILTVPNATSYIPIFFILYKFDILISNYINFVSIKSLHKSCNMQLFTLEIY